MFREICDNYFNDESLLRCCWKDRRTLIFDETFQEAYVLVALPEHALDSYEKNDISYRFITEKVVKIESGWKLSDECLCDFKNFSKI